LNTWYKTCDNLGLQAKPRDKPNNNLMMTISRHFESHKKNYVYQHIHNPTYKLNIISHRKNNQIQNTKAILSVSKRKEETKRKQNKTKQTRGQQPHCYHSSRRKIRTVYMMICGSGTDSDISLCGNIRPPFMYSSSLTSTSSPSTETFSILA
jgi:hypothetical protein